MTGGGPVSIAIIDSGVNPDHPHVRHVSGGVRIELDGSASDDFVDRLGHGTAVFAAIQERAPEAQIHALRVFDDKLSTSVRALVAAIRWAADARMHLVNLSLGTPKEGHATVLEEATAALSESGGLIVAAAESDGQRWLPGSLPGAIGVLADPTLPRDVVRVRRRPADGPVLVASPFPRPIPGVPKERNLNGISFAVANASGAIAVLLQERQGLIGKAAILQALADA